MFRRVPMDATTARHALVASSPGQPQQDAHATGSSSTSLRSVALNASNGFGSVILAAIEATINEPLNVDGAMAGRAQQ